MALISLRQLLDYAAEHQFGVPAFNVNNLEQMRAIMTAAQSTESPVIVQASSGARTYAGSTFIQALVRAAESEWPNIPICLHQDHGASPDVCLRAIQLGFTSVMMDGSLHPDMSTPSDFQYNARTTAHVVQMAHAVGVSVEGELGCLGSLETQCAHKEDGSGADGSLSKQQLLTDPDEAARFVQATRVDALAVAIGTSHGAYKFTRPPGDDLLDMKRLQDIHKRLPNTHLVLHGSSSVPKEWLDLINAHGGSLPSSYGVPISEIQKGIQFGVRKINIDTDLRLAFTASVRRYLNVHPTEFDPRKYLSEAVLAMQGICEARYTAFGCAGHAQKIRIQSLESMMRCYSICNY